MPQERHVYLFESPEDTTEIVPVGRHKYSFEEPEEEPLPPTFFEQVEAAPRFDEFETAPAESTDVLNFPGTDDELLTQQIEKVIDEDEKRITPPVEGRTLPTGPTPFPNFGEIEPSQKWLEFKERQKFYAQLPGDQKPGVMEWIRDEMNIAFGAEPGEFGATELAANVAANVAMLPFIPLEIGEGLKNRETRWQTLKGLALFAPDQLNNLLIAANPAMQLTEAGKQVQLEAQKRIFEDPLMPIFAALIGKGVIKAPKKLKASIPKAKQQVLDIAEIIEKQRKGEFVPITAVEARMLAKVTANPELFNATYRLVKPKESTPFIPLLKEKIESPLQRESINRAKAAIAQAEKERVATLPKQPKQPTEVDRFGKVRIMDTPSGFQKWTPIRQPDGGVMVAKRSIEPGDYRTMLARRKASTAAYRTRFGDKEFIPESALENMPATRAIRGVNVGRDYDATNIIVGKSPLSAKPLYEKDLTKPATYDQIVSGEVPGVLAGETDFDVLSARSADEIAAYKSGQAMVPEVYWGEYGGMPEYDYSEVQAPIRAEERVITKEEFFEEVETLAAEYKAEMEIPKPPPKPKTRRVEAEERVLKNFEETYQKQVEQLKDKEYLGTLTEQQVKTLKRSKKIVEEQIRKIKGAEATTMEVSLLPGLGKFLESVRGKKRLSPTDIDDLYAIVRGKGEARGFHVEDARKVHEMYERSDIELKALKKKSLKDTRRRVAQLVVDASANVKGDLLKKGGELGTRAVIHHDLIRGSHAKAAQIVKDAEKEIFSGLSKYEEKMLWREIGSRRVISIHKDRPEVRRTEGLTGKQHEEYIKSFGSELRHKIDKRADAYFKVMKQQLKDLLDNGLIDKEIYNKLEGMEYSKSKFIQYIDPVRRIDYQGGRKITVHESGLRSLKEGSEQVLEYDARLLLAEVVTHTQTRIMRNNANQTLLELAVKQPDNPIVSLAKVIGVTKSGTRIWQKTPVGYEAIWTRIEGKEQKLLMPKDLAREWVESDPQISATAANVFGWLSGAKILRPMATGLNPGFAFTNFPRDVAHVYLSTQEYSMHAPIFIPQFGRDLGATMKDTFTRKGRYRDYINEGGGMEFLTHQGGGGAGAKMSGRWGQVARVLGYIGETSEIWTRLALRERALRRGKDPIQATWVARNYLDFAQGGGMAKAADIAFPYFNAGIQGTRGIFRSAKTHPGQFAVKLGWIGAAEIGLYLANRYTNPEAWDNIPSGDKDRNWITTTPWSYKDERGERRDLYFKVAKDQGQRVISTFFRSLMERALEDKYPKDEMFDSIQDFMRIVPVGELPPTLDAILGYAANKDFWRLEDIWKGPKLKPGYEKEAYRPGTHPFFISAGKVLKMNPTKLRYSLSQLFTRGNVYTAMMGGTWKAITGTLDNNLQEKAMTELLTSNPDIRRVFSSTPPKGVDRKEKERIEAEATAARWVLTRDFDEALVKWDKGKIEKEEVRKFIQEKAPDSFEKVRLIERFRRFKRMKDVPDKFFWLGLASIRIPEARARVFWVEWEKSSDKKRVELEKLAHTVPNIWGNQFAKTFIELKKKAKE